MTASDFMQIRTSPFNRGLLDRLNNDRRHDNFLQLNITSTSRFLIFSHSLQVLTILDASATLALLPPEHVPPLPPLAKDPPMLVLGKDIHDISYLAVRLPQTYNPHAWLSTLPHNHASLKFIHLRSVVRTFQPAHAAIAAHALSLFEFHSRHIYCGSCGARTIPDQGGSRRRCQRNVHAVEPKPASDITSSPDKLECHGMWFPRTDPVVIMLVVDRTDNRVLLGREKQYSHGLFSCLAGFMEHAEGVDDAVRREVFEESGVVIGPVRFFGSQAWPFPFSLMLGCVAQATQEDIKVDDHELEDARWFTREQVIEMVDRAENESRVVDGAFFVPPETTIAGQMLAAYASGDPITSFSQPTEDHVVVKSSSPSRL